MSTHIGAELIHELFSLSIGGVLAEGEDDPEVMQDYEDELKKDIGPLFDFLSERLQGWIDRFEIPVTRYNAHTADIWQKFSNQSDERHESLKDKKVNWTIRLTNVRFIKEGKIVNALPMCFWTLTLKGLPSKETLDEFEEFANAQCGSISEL